MKSYVQSSKTLTVSSETSTATVSLLPLSSSLPSQFNLGNRFVVDVLGTAGSHAKLPFTSLFNFAGDFTIECWVKRGAWAGSYARILDRNYAAGFSINRNGGGETITLSVNSNQFSSSVNLLPEWTHVAIVRSGTTGYIYMNGVQVGTANVGSAAVSNSEAIFIGVNGTTSPGGEGMPLRMGEVRVWSVARSNALILGNMSKTLDFKSEGLVGYWPMFKGDTKDYSLNENPALTAVGTATIIEDIDFLRIFE